MELKRKCNSYYCETTKWMDILFENATKYMDTLQILGLGKLYEILNMIKMINVLR